MIQACADICKETRSAVWVEDTDIKDYGNGNIVAVVFYVGEKPPYSAIVYLHRKEYMKRMIEILAAGEKYLGDGYYTDRFKVYEVGGAL